MDEFSPNLKSIFIEICIVLAINLSLGNAYLYIEAGEFTSLTTFQIINLIDLIFIFGGEKPFCNRLHWQLSSLRSQLSA